MWFGVAVALLFGLLRLGLPIYRPLAAIAAARRVGAEVEVEPGGPEWLRDRLGDWWMQPWDTVVQFECPFSETAADVLQQSCLRLSPRPTLRFYDAPLRGYIQTGDIQRIRSAVRRNPVLLNAFDDYSDTPLQVAVSGDEPLPQRLKMLQLLIDEGADIHAPLAPDEGTLLHRAQDPEIVEVLLRHHIPLEVRNSGGTALDAAAYGYAHAAPDDDEERRNRLAIVRQLQRAGAKYGIHAACRLGDADKVAAVLSSDPTQAHDHFALTIASWNGQTEIVRLLLSAGADPNPPTSESGMPVAYFALKHPDVLKLLLDAGAQPNASVDYQGSGTGPHGLKLMHHAVATGKIDAVRLLIEKGADVNCRTGGYAKLHGATPLHHAVESSRDIAEFLLDHGADVNAVDVDGQTPLVWAQRDPTVLPEIAELLIQRGGVTISKP